MVAGRLVEAPRRSASNAVCLLWLAGLRSCVCSSPKVPSGTTGSFVSLMGVPPRQGAAGPRSVVGAGARSLAGAPATFPFVTRILSHGVMPGSCVNSQVGCTRLDAGRTVGRVRA